MTGFWFFFGGGCLVVSGAALIVIKQGDESGVAIATWIAGLQPLSLRTKKQPPQPPTCPCSAADEDD